MTSASFCFFSPPAGKASASVAIFLLPFVPAVAAVFPVRVCRRGLSVRGDRRRIETGAHQFAFGLREAIGGDDLAAAIRHAVPFGRSEEHPSEIQYLIRISYAVFCLKKKIKAN